MKREPGALFLSSFNAIRSDYVDTGVRFLSHSGLQYLTVRFIDTIGVNSSDRKFNFFSETFECYRKGVIK